MITTVNNNAQNIFMPQDDSEVEGFFPPFLRDCDPVEFPASVLRFYKSLNKDLFRKLFHNLVEFRNRVGEDFPPNVFASSAIVASILRSHIGKRAFDPEISDGVQYMSYPLAACLNWYPTQDVIQFEPSVYEELCSNVPSIRFLPWEILCCLPAYGVWVVTPNLVVEGAEIFGFFAYYDFSFEEGSVELKVVPVSKSRGDEVILAFPLHEGAYISNDVDVKSARTIINLLLYICSHGVNPAVAGATATGQPTVQYAKPKKTKKGWKFFPPSKPAVHTLGKSCPIYQDIMRNIREKEAAVVAETTDGRTVTPHVRRAHWHRFWTGSEKSGNRKLVSKWVAPCVVNGGLVAEDGATLEVC